MALGRRGTYYGLLLVALVVVAMVLMSTSAWSQQDNDGKKDERKTRVEKSEARTANNSPSQAGAQQVGTQAEETANDITLSKIDEPDPVEVNGLLLYTVEVTNNDNTNSQDVVVVDDLPNSVDLLAVDISGGTGTGDCVENDGEDEVYCVVTLDDASTNDDTATIQILVEPEEVREIDNFVEVFEASQCDLITDPSPSCTGNNLVDVTEDTTVEEDNNNNNDNNNNGQFDDFFPPGVFDDFSPNDDFFNDLEEDLEEAEEDLNDLEGEVTTSEDDFTTGEGTTGNDGGAFADSGDPDDQPPVSGQRGDVVDEIPTEGPLPNTGGWPLLWIVPLIGLIILAGLPFYRWARRTHR